MDKETIELLTARLEECRIAGLEGASGPLDTEIAFFNTDRLGSFHVVMRVPQEENYEAALALLRPGDTLCDMGAGDLRFALLAAQKVKKVYAVEMNPRTLSDALDIIGWLMPRNIVAICADWRDVPVPPDVTVITCLANGAVVPMELWKANGRRVLQGVVGHEWQTVKGR